MQRIAIIGSSGSGKTTLALQLHEILHLPVYHLDQYNWLPGWKQRPFEEFAQEHLKLCQKEQWIIEGIYTRTFEERIMYADTVIFLDFSRFVCITRVLKRLWQFYNTATPSSAPGCLERLDFRFLWYVWSFNKLYKKQIMFLLKEYNDKKIYIFNKKTSLRIFLKFLQKNKS